MIGLEVKPLENRGLSDIEGVIWLNAATARLERVEYTYVNLPGGIRDPGSIGGEVVFTDLPNGTWIVRAWRVRTPLMAFVGRGVQMRRIGYHDEGASSGEPPTARGPRSWRRAPPRSPGLWSTRQDSPRVVARS